jgi:hypothetical protein
VHLLCALLIVIAVGRQALPETGTLFLSALLWLKCLPIHWVFFSCPVAMYLRLHLGHHARIPCIMAVVCWWLFFALANRKTAAVRLASCARVDRNDLARSKSCSDKSGISVSSRTLLVEGVLLMGSSLCAPAWKFFHHSSGSVTFHSAS